MSKCIDLTGQRFGQLTVLKRYPENKNNRAQWECQCDCGKIVVYTTASLKSGKTQSCGCKRKKDLSGQKFGRLTVVEYAYSNNGQRYWKCECDCGKIAYVNTTSLTSGNTKSCGCLHSDILKQNNIKLKSKIDQSNIIGQVFDFLEVIAPVDSDGQSIYKCYCHNCGNYKNIKYSDLISNRVHACGCLYSWAEAKLKLLLNKYSINYINQFKFSDLKSQKGIPLRFDFGIFKNDKLYCVIEYQGNQHFDKTNLYWTPLLELHDNMKKDYCNQHDIKLIELTKESNLEDFVKQLAQELLL